MRAKEDGALAKSTYKDEVAVQTWRLLMRMLVMMLASLISSASMTPSILNRQTMVGFFAIRVKMEPILKR